MNRRKIKTSIKAYIFLAPFLILFIAMVVYPIFLGAKLSLYGMRGARTWYVGLDNYIRIFQDPKFWSSFKIPLFLLLIQVPLMLFIATIFAILFERMSKRGGAIYRFIYYLPYTIPGIVSGIVWSYIFSDSMSPFRPLLDLLGYSGLKIMTRQNLPLLLLFIILWAFTGYTAFIIYSSLLSIPRELTEAAQLDGASFWQTAFKIKIPLLKDVILTLFIFNAIGSIQVFNEPWMLQNLVVLPNNYTPAMYIYNSAFSSGRFTYAAAMGIILAIITFLISLYFLKTASRQMLN
ncbi:carbohydrate ABC transporter permease [Halanaerobium salsuginis]|jgi:multiple sugar transport system permease protein|uniref:Multiple sugar transport system permease protein n=1 Tax=Halanaerobium salsuginis TaxID=29563 RepID=A0A1I4K1B8_9FIRM|nr:sugar ABC transporter permease [Halanaerobium salsuginis]SFL72303.1 multiple sugar transport system permease protein [Halanaerobium salsuginis]